VVTGALVPAAGQNCGSNFANVPCWDEKNPSTAPEFVYRNKTMAPHGVYKVTLRSDPQGGTGAKIDVVAQGSNLNLPPSLALTPPLKVQLRNTQTSVCWETSYSNPVTAPTHVVGIADLP
jgi:hypothetical protein